MATFEVVKDPEVAKLVCFSMGKLNPEAKEHLDFKCFESEKDDIKKTKKTVVKAEIDGMKYSGQNYGPSNHFSTDMCDYYLAVHRKGASKVQVVPAQLFMLNPEIEEEKIRDDEDHPEMSFADKRKSLIQTFGSGQIQRKLLQSERKEMQEAMMTQTTEGMAAKVISDSSFVEQQAARNNKTSSTGTPLSSGPRAIATSVPESSAIPPINKNAVTPDEVYSIRDIIPLWARGALDEQSQVFVNCTDEDIKRWREEMTYQDIVLTELEKQPKERQERSEACALIMYLHCLLHSYNLKAHLLRRREHYPDTWKGEIKKLLDEMYTVEILGDRKFNRNRPKTKKDLMTSHILVLFLKLSSNHKIDLNRLMGPLKLNFNSISLYCKLLGCRISGNTATLSLPLMFPQLRTKKEKR